MTANLNRSQLLQLNAGYAIALRATYFIEALLDLHARRSPDATYAVETIRDRLAEYRHLVEDLAEQLELSGDPHDLRPIIVDQVYRARDALDLQFVDELRNYGGLDADIERELRQRLATLALRTQEIARLVQRLAPHEL